MTLIETTDAGSARLYESFRQYWHPVAYSSELGTGPMNVRLLDHEVVLVRLRGDVCAFYDLCVHRGTPLSLGFVDNDRLRCAYHGWAYDCSGVCTEIPSVKDGRIPGRARLRRYQAAERYGLVSGLPGGRAALRAAGARPLRRSGVPRARGRGVRLALLGTASVRERRRLRPLRLAARRSARIRDRPEVPRHEVRRAGGEIRVEIEFEEPSDTQKNANLGLSEEKITAEKRYRLFMPFDRAQRAVLPGRQEVRPVLGVLAARTEADPDVHVDRPQLRADRRGRPRVLSFNEEVIAADKPVVEGQRPEELPFDLTAELHVRDADRVSIEYRKWLYELAGEAP